MSSSSTPATSSACRTAVTADGASPSRWRSSRARSEDRPARADTPTSLLNTEFLRQPDRCQQHSRALVDLVAGDQEARIRVGDHPVAFGGWWRAPRRCVTQALQKWVGGSDFRERSEQRSHRGGVYLPALAAGGTSCVLQQPILRGRRHETMSGLLHAGQSDQAESAILEDSLRINGIVEEVRHIP